MNQSITLKDIVLSEICTIEETLFSTVLRAQIDRISDEVAQTTDTKWIAIKSATINRRLSKEPHDIIKELRVLSSISHANIIAILGSQTDTTNMILKYWMPYTQYTLFELLSSSSFSPHPLLSFSTANPTRSPREDRFNLLAKSIVYQILSALAYLHDPRRRIAHRDIKPGNILLTGKGLVQVIDFGIAWKGMDGEDVLNDDLWPETEKMYFEVATGPYRAPELLFGPLTYDAQATDLWSLGATFAEFFTPLRLTRSDEDDEDDDSDASVDSVKPFIIPAISTFRLGDPTARWRRDNLFNADKGEIGLAWSIFKIFGTPNDDTWPTFRDLPDATKVTFVSVPAVDLTSLLPNLPPSAIPQARSSSSPQATPHAPPRIMSLSPLDLLHRFLVYPQSDRIRAVDALKHPWFIVDPVALLPPGYPLEHVDDGSILRSQVGNLWEGKTLGEWLRASVPHKPSED